ncbi:MAG TPA: ATP-dependent DNA helicase, partial [Candidatus Competibacteraceae bacterium]|nr:ATP-dependent DNA helicase [Candidatus Competibacteraceae bacterium]
MDIARLLGADGPLTRWLPGFAPRLAQQRMAAAVETILSGGGTLVVEAGTGTGKTYAYLVPALLAGRRVMISTGTRHLQDQLYHRDLPLLRQALQIPVKTALLKGRGNYLCHYRLDATEREGRLATREQVAALQRIRDWATRTRSGDIAEVGDVPEDASIWPRVTSTVDNCLGQECPRLQDCFLARARREAQAADLLVINHHLFCADMAIRETGFAEILPGAEAIIFDEAHQLPEVASYFFGRSLSGRQLLELARDTRVEQLRDAADFGDLRVRAAALEPAVLALREALGLGDRRALWREVATGPALRAAVMGVATALEQLRAALQEAAARGKGLEHCLQRCEDLAQRLELLSEPAEDEVRVRWFETQGR